MLRYFVDFKDIWIMISEEVDGETKFLYHIFIVVASFKFIDIRSKLVYYVYNIRNIRSIKKAGEPNE